MGRDTISYGDDEFIKKKISDVSSRQKTSFHSSFFYGVVKSINADSKTIIYDTIQNNIGSSRLGEARPFYKNNSTLPQVGDLVPLILGPTSAAGVLGSQYDKTIYYLDPISVDQELAQNTIVRTSQGSALSPENNPTILDFKTAVNGFVKTNNNSLVPQSGTGYNLYEFKSKLPNGKTIDDKGFVVTIPKSNTSRTLALVFGGMYYATPEWMEGRVPIQYKSNKIFVFADSWKNGINLTTALNFINKHFPGTSISSVCGFSLGGLQAWAAASRRIYPFVGLIDPSTRPSDADSAYSSPNVIMVYRPKNWVSVANYSQNQRNAAAKMGAYALYLDMNMKVINPPPSLSQEEKDGKGSNHEKIPKWFFDNYGGRL